MPMIRTVARRAMSNVFAKIMSLSLACLFAQGLAQAAEPATGASGPFSRIATVLLHPRCVNCHTASDHPNQGEDQHRHSFRVVRGRDDRGAEGMRCASCHQSLNNAASKVPGASDWRAAPLSMAWEGKTPAQLCRALLDRRQNGNRSVSDLVAHMADDPLVAWGWSPGAEREPVPIAKADFIALLRDWQKSGTPCPR